MMYASQICVNNIDTIVVRHRLDGKSAVLEMQCVYEDTEEVRLAF